jgi:hypothetical protein
MEMSSLMVVVMLRLKAALFATSWKRRKIHVSPSFHLVFRNNGDQIMLLQGSV